MQLTASLMADAAVPAAPPAIRVLVVDDHVMFAESLQVSLERFEDIVVVGVAHNGADAVLKVGQFQPSVVLLDHQLPDLRGPEVASAILRRYPMTAVLMLTASATVRAATAAIEAGCIGFVTKDQCVADVADAVRDASRGRAHISAAMVSHLLPRSQRSTGPNLNLSNRELELLDLIGQGLTGPAIAEQLRLSHHTVRNHTSNILRKLGVHSRFLAVAEARRMRLIGDPL